MRKIAILVLIIALAAFGTSVQTHALDVLIRLYDASGAQVGTARLDYSGAGRVVVDFSVKGLPPGFHGFHVHAVGLCEPPFTSAGGHHNPAGTSHPGHAGDLPVILVNDTGVGWGKPMTTRFTTASLFDDNGSALIIHANPDNYGNIPTDRYDPDPDATTLATGDAGPRIACGVIAPPRS